MRSDIVLEDTTLRDGEQAPGVAFSYKTKLAIFDLLVLVGIKWIEVGIPAMKGEEVRAIQAMHSRADGVNLVAWNRGVMDEVRYSLSLGFKHIHVGLPTSNSHLSDSLRKDRSWLLSTASDLIKYAKDNDAFVSISAEDVGRTDLSFLQDYACHVEEAGADRLRLSDTIGILSSEQYASIIKHVRQASDIDLHCHCHNDFGLAVANTLAGLEAGARYFHVTVNGIGERAGMPDLAQIALALKHFHQKDLGIDLTQLIPLSQRVSNATRVVPLPWQPIVGKNVFAHESGIHASGTIRQGNTFEPFSPEVVAGERKIVIGKHSGRAGIRFVLEKNKVDPNEDLLALCLERVRDFSMKNERSLSEEELCNIYQKCEVELEPA